MPPKKHIAIVAPIGAGKTTAARFFEEKGFKLYRLSQVIYEVAEVQGIDARDRTALQDLGDSMREERGLSVLAQIAVEKIAQHPERSYAIDSIRNHHELQTLKAALGDELLILAISAPIETRYTRVVERQGQYNEQATSFKQFQDTDARDLGESNAENEQNVAKCLAMAEMTIGNNNSEEAFTKSLEPFYQDHFE